MATMFKANIHTRRAGKLVWLMRAALIPEMLKVPHKKILLTYMWEVAQFLFPIHNYGGLTQTEPNDLPQNDGGTNFYRKFASEQEYADAYIADMEGIHVPNTRSNKLRGATSSSVDTSQGDSVYAQIISSIINGDTKPTFDASRLRGNFKANQRTRQANQNRQGKVAQFVTNLTNEIQILNTRQTYKPSSPSRH